MSETFKISPRHFHTNWQTYFNLSKSRNLLLDKISPPRHEFVVVVWSFQALCSKIDFSRQKNIFFNSVKKITIFDSSNTYFFCKMRLSNFFSYKKWFLDNYLCGFGPEQNSNSQNKQRPHKANNIRIEFEISLEISCIIEILELNQHFSLC